MSAKEIQNIIEGISDVFKKDRTPSTIEQAIQFERKVYGNNTSRWMGELKPLAKAGAIKSDDEIAAVILSLINKLPIPTKLSQEFIRMAKEYISVQDQQGYRSKRIHRPVGTRCF